MQEFFTLMIVVAALGVVIYFLHDYLDKIAWWIEQHLNLGANALILFVMLYVVSEVLMRTLFNSPLEGHLEISELITPGIIFLALAYTQSTGGHVRMTLVVDMLPQAAKRYAEIFNLVLSVGIYSVLTFYSGNHTYRTWNYGDSTMMYEYAVWPSTLVVTIGFFFSTLRLYLDLLEEMFPNKIQRKTKYTPKHLEGFE